MTDSKSGWVWPWLALILGGFLAAAVIRALSGAGEGSAFRLVEMALLAVMALMTGLSVLLLVRKPGHRVGWIFAGALTYLMISLVGDTYVAAGIEGGLSLPGIVWAAWMYNTLAPLLWLCIALLLLTFPTGALPSARWSPVAAFAVAWYVGNTVAWMISPGPMTDYGVLNPLGWDAAGAAISAFTGLFWPVNGLVIIAAAASLVARYRKAVGVERQQLKWLAVSGAMIVLGGAILLLSTATGAGHDSETAIVDWFGPVLFGGGIGSIPIFAALAILRYRLYDLDRIISRTLSYGLLTGSLVVCYAVAVAVISPAAASLGGGSQFGVAVATLATAAAFQPLRRRVQAVVDRRFNRARYDAQRIVRAFAERLREPVDVEDVEADLLATVAAVVSPRRLSMWVPSDVQAPAP